MFKSRPARSVIKKVETSQIHFRSISGSAGGDVLSSVDRRIGLDLGTDENAAIAVVEGRREVEIGKLFDENGELRRWQDSASWSGYLRLVLGGETRHDSANTRFDDVWFSKTR